MNIYSILIKQQREEKLDRYNVGIIHRGPKAGQIFSVRSPRKQRRLRLRNAKWILYNSSSEYASGFIQGYLAHIEAMKP